MIYYQILINIFLFGSGPTPLNDLQQSAQLSLHPFLYTVAVSPFLRPID
jgi:hypothetical protein